VHRQRTDLLNCGLEVRFSYSEAKTNVLSGLTVAPALVPKVRLH
jgi:hypothetical protein